MNFDTSRLLKLTYTYIRQRIRNIKGKYAKLSWREFQGCSTISKIEFVYLIISNYCMKEGIILVNSINFYEVRLIEILLTMFSNCFLAQFYLILEIKWNFWHPMGIWRWSLKISHFLLHHTFLIYSLWSWILTACMQIHEFWYIANTREVTK